jgi:hypothetical protein
MVFPTVCIHRYDGGLSENDTHILPLCILFITKQGLIGAHSTVLYMYYRSPEEMKHIKKQHRYMFCLVEVHIGSNVVHEQ